MHAQSGWDQEIDLAIAEYSTFLPSKTPGLLLLYVLGHRSFVLLSASNQLCLIWLNLDREYIPVHLRIHPAASVTSSLNTSNPVPLEAMHAHATTLLHHVSQMMLNALDRELFHTLILISAVQRIIFQKCSVFLRCFLAKSNLFLFAPFGGPSVFTLVKSSLDCRLWQRHVYLLESVLRLAGCCERVFLYHGVDPLIIYHCCPPWASRPFYVAEFTSALFFLIGPLLTLLFLWWICFIFKT